MRTRQLSAHLSEIESVDGIQQQGDENHEGYESDNRLIQSPRGSHNRQNEEGVAQPYEEVSCHFRFYQTLS
jgi:hypothetical protein